MYSQRKPVLPPEQEELITTALDCGLTVHRVLGPGDKEKIYQRAFCLELDSRGISFECEKPVDVQYKQWKIPGQRIDLIVSGVVLVEIKAVSELCDEHRAQVHNYLRITGFKLGLLVNFGHYPKLEHERIVY